MIRFLLRFLGFWILAGGFVALVVDGTRSIAASSLVMTSGRSAWVSVSATSFETARARLSGLAGWAWSDIAAPVLDLPLSAILAVLGLLLMMLGRTRRRSPYDTR